MEQLENRFQISGWIAEDFAGVISEEHKTLLNKWRQESAENEKEYQELLEQCREGKGIPTQEERQELQRQWKRFVAGNSRRRVVLRRWMVYAAGVVVLLGTIGVMRWQWGELAEEVVAQHVEIAQGQVVLILSNGKTVAVQKDSVQVVKEETAAEIRVAGETISYAEETGRMAGEVFNTLVIPKGGEYKIVLADGSKVWLNSETEFRYPVNFSGELRQVYLKGEAYFEVAGQEGKPFVVVTSGGVDVKVLGTRFNVASYPEDAEVVTTLAEGSVEMYTADKAVRIRPDEQVLFDRSSHSFQRRQVDAAAYLAWKDGKFIFEDQSLEQIMRQLQRWYEMDVFYASEAVRNYRFSGDLKKYDDFGKIVKMLEEVAGLKISIQNKCVVIGAK